MQHRILPIHSYAASSGRFLGLLHSYSSRYFHLVLRDYRIASHLGKHSHQALVEGVYARNGTDGSGELLIT